MKVPVDEIWTNQGILIHQAEGTYEAPCASARNAIAFAMKSKNLDYFRLLLSDKALRGRALELLFLQSFSKANAISPVAKIIPLDGSNTLTISVKSIIYQSAQKQISQFA